jgi:prephenate dehydrogenase
MSVLVVGTGLIGTSIALGLAAQGQEVFLTDIDASALDSAVKVSGARIYKDQQISLVIVATPPANVAKVIFDCAAQHPTAVLTDVASVKVSVFTELNELGFTHWDRLVGGHPMAGREVSGAQGAQGNLFLDRPWVLTTNSDTTEHSLSTVRQLVESLGAFAILRTNEEHDQAVALISHTPQVVASVLAGELLDADLSQIELAGQGIRDTIRIAGSDALLWTDILRENSNYIAARVTNVANSLLDFAAALTAGEDAKVTAKLIRGAQGRDRLPGKHGVANQNTTTIAVRLDDKPGELARVFTEAAKAQVNLEDVRIDHSFGKPTGLVELTVSLSTKATLLSVLESANFVVIG